MPTVFALPDWETLPYDSFHPTRTSSRPACDALQFAENAARDRCHFGLQPDASAAPASVHDATAWICKRSEESLTDLREQMVIAGYQRHHRDGHGSLPSEVLLWISSDAEPLYR